MKNKFLILAVVGINFILSSCNNESCTNIENGKVKINLVANIRNNLYTRNQSAKTEFNKNDNIGVYLVDYINNAPMPIGSINDFMNTEYIYDGTYWYSKEGEDLYLSANDSKANVFAYTPFDYEMSRNPLKTDLRAYPFSVQTDQSLSSKESDFLWAQYSAVSETNNTAKLNFKHLLSKVIINVKYGSLGNNFESILIHNVTLDSKIDMQNGLVSNIGNTSYIQPYIHAIPNSGFDKTLSAIIVPQLVDAGSTLFSLTTNNQHYAYIVEDDIVLHSGMAYTFNLIIGEALSKTNNTITSRAVIVSPISISTM